MLIIIKIVKCVTVKFNFEEDHWFRSQYRSHRTHLFHEDEIIS